MVDICKEDLDQFETVGSGRFGVVYKKDDNIAYKIYYPSFYDDFGQVISNPTLKLSPSRYKRLIARSKKLLYSGGVLDTIYLHGNFGGVVIPYYDGKRLSQMMQEDFSIKVDISNQLVRNAKELSSNCIYPTDYKLNNILYADGNVRIIDLDDKRTHVTRVPNPILNTICINGLGETIETFFHEYHHLALPKSISKQIARKANGYYLSYQSIEGYIYDKSIKRDFIMLDSQSDLNSLPDSIHDQSRLVFAIDERLSEEEYQVILNCLRNHNLSLYDFVLRDNLDNYWECENANRVISYMK